MTEVSVSSEHSWKRPVGKWGRYSTDVIQSDLDKNWDSWEQKTRAEKVKYQ